MNKKSNLLLIGLILGLTGQIGAMKYSIPKTLPETPVRISNSCNEYVHIKFKGSQRHSDYILLKSGATVDSLHDVPLKYKDVMQKKLIIASPDLKKGYETQWPNIPNEQLLNKDLAYIMIAIECDQNNNRSVIVKLYDSNDKEFYRVDVYNESIRRLLNKLIG